MKKLKRPKSRRKLKLMSLTDVQTSKLVGALQPLYADPDFSTVTEDFVVKVTQLPPSPQPITDEVDVPRS